MKRLSLPYVAKLVSLSVLVLFVMQAAALVTPLMPAAYAATVNNSNGNVLAIRAGAAQVSSVEMQSADCTQFHKGEAPTFTCGESDFPRFFGSCLPGQTEFLHHHDG